MAIKIAAAFVNSAEFWLNIQHANDVWEANNKLEEGSEGVDLCCL